MHTDDRMAQQLIALFPEPYNDMAQTTWDWSHDRARQEGVEIGRQEGVEIGRQEGVEIGRAALLETARRLASASVPLSLICEATGLSERELGEILADDE